MVYIPKNGTKIQDLEWRHSNENAKIIFVTLFLKKKQGVGQQSNEVQS